MKGAILAGCRAYYGYPITPASEIAESAALYLPQVGGTFLQAESEVAAINIRRRRYRRSCDDGFFRSRHQLDAGGHLVYRRHRVAVRHRIAPEHYFAMVKGGGHGNYRNIVLAPASVQEMAEHTTLAFDLADRYRSPAVLLSDGFVGQMIEPLDLHYDPLTPEPKPWAVQGTAETRKNLVASIFLEPDDLDRHQRQMEAKYARIQQMESRHEGYEANDAELLVVGYGIVSRVLRTTLDQARREGSRVACSGLSPCGHFRPRSLGKRRRLPRRCWWWS